MKARHRYVGCGCENMILLKFVVQDLNTGFLKHASCNGDK